MSSIAASLAGAPVAQTTASEGERAQQAAGQKLRAQVAAQAELTAGVGATDGEEHSTNDRDADGRRLWEAPLQRARQDEVETADPAPPHLSKDPTGEAGQTLDLSG
jgi:hypothetical protein